MTHPKNVQLIIEIAKSSIQYDHGVKADTYSSLGVEDYWVINAVTLETRIHRRPTPDLGYLDKRELAATDTLMQLSLPQLAIRLADLDFGDEGLRDDEP